MCLAHGLAQAVSNQCTSRHHTLHHPMVNHRADDLAHFGDRHRPGECHYDRTVPILDHGPQHFIGLAQAAASECCLAHGD